MQFREIIISSSLVALAAACSSENSGGIGGYGGGSSGSNKFKGGTKQEIAPVIEVSSTPAQPNAGTIFEETNTFQAGDQSISSGCEGQKASQSVVPVTQDSGGRVVIRGQFCPSDFKRLNVMFIIDASASIESSSKDETVNNQCKRLEAAKALLTQIKAGMRKGDRVRVGVVRFSTTAEVQSSLTSIEQFIGFKDNGTTFCNRQAEGALTNYEAAFVKAKEALTAADGNSTVYFLTDGNPTEHDSPNTDDDAAALKSAGDLKTAIKGSIINMLYLGTPSRSNLALMQNIAGNPSQVRIAADAQSLASELVKFSFPKFALKKEDVTAQLQTFGAAAMAVNIANVQVSPDNPSMFNYETEAFTPPASPTAGVKAKRKLEVRAPSVELVSTTEFDY